MRRDAWTKAGRLLGPSDTLQLPTRADFLRVEFVFGLSGPRTHGHGDRPRAERVEPARYGSSLPFAV